MKRILFACAMGMPLGGFLDYVAMLAYGSDKPTATHVWMAITGACVFWFCYELTPKILNSTKSKTESKSKVLNIPRVSQQRELLLAFAKHRDIYTDETQGLNELDVDEFLKANNCG